VGGERERQERFRRISPFEEERRAQALSSQSGKKKVFELASSSRLSLLFLSLLPLLSLSLSSLSPAAPPGRSRIAAQSRGLPGFEWWVQSRRRKSVSVFIRKRSRPAGLGRDLLPRKSLSDTKSLTSSSPLSMPPHPEKSEATRNLRPGGDIGRIEPRKREGDSSRWRLGELSFEQKKTVIARRN